MLFLGDLHGNFAYLGQHIDYVGLKNKNIIQVGDFGIGFARRAVTMEQLHLINEGLKMANCHMYVIRGNHDNPEYFDGSIKFSHLELLADYSVREIEGKRILFVGGAISIDRLHRTEGKSYWKDEVFVFNRQEAEQCNGIDIVVTHNSPKFAIPIGVDAPIVNAYATIDPTLKAELTEERQAITDLYDCVNENNLITHWIYGHFHSSDSMFYGTTEFRLLGIGEFFELK